MLFPRGDSGCSDLAGGHGEWIAGRHQATDLHFAYEHFKDSVSLFKKKNHKKDKNEEERKSLQSERIPLTP